MRLVSNTESVKKGEPAVLAIAESLAAVSLSIWAVVHFETWVHVAIGACLAPLLLLRTEQSCRAGVQVADRLNEWVNSFSDGFLRITKPPDESEKTGWLSRTLSMRVPFPLLLILVPFSACVKGVIFACSRLMGTFVAAVCHPWLSISAVPANWRRVVLASDSFTAPELLPTPMNEIPSVTMNLNQLGNVYALLAFAHRKIPLKQWQRYVLYPVALLYVLPAFLYRWSLKSTAFVWWPLLFTLSATKDKGGPFLNRLRVWTRDPITTIVRYWGALCIGLFLTKVFLWMAWNDFAQWWNQTRLQRVLAVYVSPVEIPIWQAATFVNSLLVWGMWVYICRVIVHLEEGLPQEETVVIKLRRSVMVIRRILTSYTISCMLYLTIREANSGAWRLPPLSGKLFPW